jgi:hypothetical protein
MGALVLPACRLLASLSLLHTPELTCHQQRGTFSCLGAEVQGVIHLGVLGFYSVNQPHKLP